MFKGRVISRSNINGKTHTFQKDFDDYDSYQEFIQKNPEYSTKELFENIWNPWRGFDILFNPYAPQIQALPADTKHLPEGVDLEKYEKRRTEKRQSEAEKFMKKQSLERTQSYLTDYLEENPDDSDAQADLEKVQKELQKVA